MPEAYPVETPQLLTVIRSQTDRGVVTIAKSNRAWFTREKMLCGSPARRKWCHVVRTGYRSINGGNPVYAGGCMIFQGLERAAEAWECFLRNY